MATEGGLGREGMEMGGEASGHGHSHDSPYAQIATLADRNILQVEYLERQVACIVKEKEALAQENFLARKKLKQASNAVEEALTMQSNIKSKLQMKQQEISVKKDSSSEWSSSVSALTEEIEAIKESIEKQRRSFIQQYSLKEDEIRQMWASAVPAIDQSAEKLSEASSALRRNTEKCSSRVFLDSIDNVLSFYKSNHAPAQ